MMTRFNEIFNVKERMREVFIGAQVVALLALIGNYYANGNLYITAFLTIASVVNYLAIIALQKNRLELSGTIFLTNLCLCTTAIIWLHAGLRSSAIFVYPGLVIYAAILGTPRQFIAVTTFLALSMVSVGFLQLFGILEFETAVIDMADPIELALILLIIAFALRNVFNDLKGLTESLTNRVNEVQLSRQEIEHIAHHDSLTGLPNRVLAEDRFNRALKHVKRQESTLSILFLDLDKFKPVNDHLGHDVGDQLLIEVAQRIELTLREDDSVCRFGGDEFIIILQSPKEELLVTAIADKILDAIRKDFTIDQHQISISASIGIATAPNDGDDFTTLCKKADMAMYKAKQQGRDGIAFFDNALDRLAEEKFKLSDALTKAVAERDFSIYYQPKYNLTTEKIIGAEALLRWPQSNGKMIAPDAFIPVAEENSLIIELGEWVLNQACLACRQWHLMGKEELTIAVNLSVIQFKHNNLPEKVRNALTVSGLEAKYLELEIKEEILLETSFNIRSQLQAIQSIGVRISVENFGSGFSNLAYINDNNLSTLKIDRDYILRVVEDPGRQSMVTAIIQMAKGLGLQTVAVGIESEQVLAYLKALECDLAQGFYWSEPLDDNSFKQFISEHCPVNS
jgi:diguanylate cyclase (GGDEF)-like protein